MVNHVNTEMLIRIEKLEKFIEKFKQKKYLKKNDFYKEKVKLQKKNENLENKIKKIKKEFISKKDFESEMEKLKKQKLLKKKLIYKN